MGVEVKGAGDGVVMDRLCNMEHEQQNCCCETKGLKGLD